MAIKAVYTGMSNAMKVTRRMADLVLELYTTGMSSYDELGLTAARCFDAGLVLPDGTVTEAGKIIARAELDGRAASKATARANAKARSQTLRDLGLRKTPYGWE